MKFLTVCYILFYSISREGGGEYFYFQMTMCTHVAPTNVQFQLRSNFLQFRTRLPNILVDYWFMYGVRVCNMRYTSHRKPQSEVISILEDVKLLLFSPLILNFSPCNGLRVLIKFQDCRKCLEEPYSYLNVFFLINIGIGWSVSDEFHWRVDWKLDIGLITFFLKLIFVGIVD